MIIWGTILLVMIVGHEYFAALMLFDRVPHPLALSRTRFRTLALAGGKSCDLACASADIFRGLEE